jgi:hypothetical protein
MLAYLRQENLIPVKADPWTRMEGHPTRSWTIKAVGQDLVEAIADGISEMHYLSSLFSGGGFSGHDSEERPLPKQSVVGCVQMSPREISAVTELLTGQLFAGEEVVRDGGAPYIPSEEEEGTWKCLEGQFRSVSFGAETFEELKSSTSREEALSHLEEAAVSKGTLRPYRRRFIRRRLEQFREDLRALWPEEKARYRKVRDRYWRAHEVLRRALSSDDGTLILAKEDQVKIGSGAHESGRALVTRTFLEGEGSPDRSGEGRLELRRERMKPSATSPSAPLRPELKAAHAHTETSVRAMPVQYPMQMNSQQFQFLKPSAEKPFYEHLRKRARELREKLCTTQGIASLVSEQEAQTRRDLESEEETPLEVDQDKTLLNLAIQSGAVQMESKAREAALRGETPSPEQVHMPRQVHSRLGSVLASRASKGLLRGLGGEGKGYLHATVQDSQRMCTRLWRAGEASISTPDEVRYRSRYPFYDASCCALPQRVTGLMNADDDGDLTVGIAAPYELEDGRVVKMVLLWRYPCVDAPIFWALPAGEKTPFDAESPAQRETYRDVLEIFKPYVPDGEPGLHSDGITLARTERAWRLSDKGAKGQVTKERISGEITPKAAFDFCLRGASLDQAGPLTRDLERFGELARRARKEQVESPAQQEYFEQAKREFLARGGETQVSTEELLSAFKYRTQGGSEEAFQSPPFVPETHTMQDPLGHHGEENVTRRVLPMDYHGELQSVERCVEAYASETETSLEGLELTTGCMISQALAKLMEEEVSSILDAFRRIDTSPTYFSHGPPSQSPGGLKKDLVEWHSSASEEDVKEVKAQSVKIRQAFGVWRRAWTLLIEEQEEIIQAADPAEKQEVIERIQEERQEISGALRRYMKSVAKGKRPCALKHAIFVDWGIEENSAAAGMALVSDRLGEVFPAPDVTYNAAPQEVGSAVAYCHSDLPGRLFEEVEVTRCAEAPEGDGPEGSLVAEAAGETYHLHPANGEESLLQVLPAEELSLRRTSRRRAVLQAE